MERQEKSAGHTGPEGGSVAWKGNSSEFHRLVKPFLTKLIVSRRAEEFRRASELSARAPLGAEGVPELWESMPKVARDFEFHRTQDGQDPELEDLDGVSAF